MTGPAELTMNEAAQATGTSYSTIKRRLKSGAFPGARQADPRDPRSPWLIPATDLLASGLLVQATGPLPPADAAAVTAERVEVGELRVEAARLRAEVEGLRGRLDERGLLVEALQQQLHMLTAGGTAAVEGPRRRRWGRR